MKKKKFHKNQELKINQALRFEKQQNMCSY